MDWLETIKTPPVKGLVGTILAPHYDPELDAIIITDQGGLVPTADEWHDLVQAVETFYRQVDTEAIRKHNDEVRNPPARSSGPALQTRRSVTRSGFVYLVRAFDGLFKIGLTKNWRQRMKALNMALPGTVEVEAIIEPGDMITLERSLHERFKEKRVNGEWFRLDASDVDYIKEMVSDF